MRRPVGVMWEERGGSRPRSLVEETLSQLRSRCSCPPQRSRVTRSGDRKLRKLKRLLEKAKRNGGLGGLAAFGDLDLDWVGITIFCLIHTPQIENQNRKVKSVAIFFYETSL